MSLEHRIADDRRLADPMILDSLLAGEPERGRLRAAVIVAHPDDESVGAGGCLPTIVPDRLLVTTGGSPRDPADAHAAGFTDRKAYAAARRAELLEAMGLIGIGAERITQWDFVDQSAALQLVSLARRVFQWLREWQPAIVLTHPFEGGHPDHDATAFAVHAAVWLLHRVDGKGPEIVEMTFYHTWNGTMRTGEFLPVSGIEERTVELSSEQQQVKRRLFGSYRTQQRVLQTFDCPHERFRLAPKYDFARTPADELFYELFDWGMTGGRWCQLARQAIEALNMSETLTC